jgi:hypothetical protein
MDTHRVGDTAESAVLHALTAAGFCALIPFGSGLPFDLAAAAPDGRIFRLQVKSGRVRNGCVIFNSCSTDHGRGRLDYRGRADFIAVYVATLDQVFLVPVDDCPSYVGVLRLSPTRNNQRKRVRLAEDYTLQCWAKRLEEAAAA